MVLLFMTEENRPSVCLECMSCVNLPDGEFKTKNYLSVRPSVCHTSARYRQVTVEVALELAVFIA